MYGYPSFSPEYRPLGWRLALAAGGVLFSVVMHALFMTVSATLADDLVGPSPDLQAALVVLATSLASLLSFALSVTGILVWVYGAATNLRAFGREGLEFSPGWAVGWWLIPFVNLVRPVQVMLEIWRASDPATLDRDNPWRWRGARATGLVAIWWTTYLVSGVFSQVHARVADADVKLATCIGGSLTLAIAGACLVAIMARVGKRQEACAAQLEDARANAYGGAYAPAPAPAWAPAHAYAHTAQAREPWWAQAS